MPLLRTSTVSPVRRRAAVLTILVLLFGLVAGGCLDHPQADRSLHYLNSARAKAGLPPLKVDVQLQKKAEAVAVTLAHRRTLQHSNLTTGITRPYASLAENLGSGGSIEQVNHLWMQSPGHRANILNPKYTLVGIGAAKVGNVTYFVQEFMQPA